MVKRILGEYSVLCDGCEAFIDTLRGYLYRSNGMNNTNKKKYCNECQAKKENIQKTKKK